MSCVHTKFCVRMPCGHIKGEVKQDLVVLSWQNALEDRNPTLGEGSDIKRGLSGYKGVA